jgi:hypothetical protein
MPEELIISTLPRELLSREKLGTHITIGLQRLFEGLAGVPDPQTLAHFKILDDLIIRQTETLGHLALASPKVQERLNVWWDDPLTGIARTERFAAALVTAVRHHQQGLPPIDSRMADAKRRTVDELRATFKVLRTKFSAAKKSPKIEDFTAAFRATIQPDGFLAANADSWCSLFTAEFPFLLNTLNQPRLSPAAIHDAWLAWATGYDQETLRQKVASRKL